MTKQEILDALERLKDYVNHVGKQEIDSIKAGISANLLEREEAITPVAETASEGKEEPEEKPFVSGGRFAEKKPAPKPVLHIIKKKKYRAIALGRRPSKETSC